MSFTPWPFASGRVANAIRMPVFKARTRVLEAASKAIDRVWHGAEQGRLLIPYRRKASRLARQRAASRNREAASIERAETGTQLVSITRSINN